MSTKASWRRPKSTLEQVVQDGEQEGAREERSQQQQHTLRSYSPFLGPTHPLRLLGLMPAK